MIADMIFSWVGQVVTAGGGGALITYFLLQYFGKSWIENQLATKLEAAKSEISLLAARKMKLHDREYIVFPDVWSKLNEAFVSVGKAQFSFRTPPSFDDMSEEKIIEWAEVSGLSKNEKDYLLEEKNKTKAYCRIFDRRDIRKAHADFSEFHNYLQCNRIFLSPDLKEKLDEIDDLLWSIWSRKNIVFEGYAESESNSFLLDAHSKYENEARPIMKEIEALVQEKLFPVINVKSRIIK
jgi:hypothetical protein